MVLNGTCNGNNDARVTRRSVLYMAAVTPCFPSGRPSGIRVPNKTTLQHPSGVHQSAEPPIRRMVSIV